MTDNKTLTIRAAVRHNFTFHLSAEDLEAFGMPPIDLITRGDMLAYAASQLEDFDFNKRVERYISVEPYFSAADAAPEPRDLDSLSENERANILYFMKRAAEARNQQWDYELQIERILGREVDDFHTEDIAAGCSEDGEAPDLTWDGVKEVLA